MGTSTVVPLVAATEQTCGNCIAPLMRFIKLLPGDKCQGRSCRGYRPVLGVQLEAGAATSFGPYRGQQRTPPSPHGVHVSPRSRPPLADTILVLFRVRTWIARFRTAPVLASGNS